MFKHITLTLAALALLSACSVKDDRLDCLTPVTIHVSDFRISLEDLPGTKATAIGSYNGVKAITLALYDTKGEEVYKATQRKGTAGYGDFSLNLPVGEYTLVALGYGFFDGDEFSLTSPTLASFTTDCRETFAAVQSLEVTGPDAMEVSATLSRIVSKLIVASTDVRPEGVARIRMGFNAGSKSFNPSTGLATSNTSFSNSVGISTAVGDPTSSVCYLFLTSDEQVVDVSIDALDAEGATLYHKEIRNVPFQRNRCTRLTGSLYSATTPASTAFQLNTAWLDNNEMDF